MANMLSVDNVDSEAPGFSKGMLRFADRDTVVESLREDAEKHALGKKPPLQVVEGLKGFLLSIWDANKEHKEREGVNEVMVESLRARKAEYSASKRAAITEFGGSSVFMGLTGTKCRAAEAWLLDVLAGRPWSLLSETPVPEYPEHLKEEALERVSRKVQFLKEQFASQGVEEPPLNVADLEAEVNREFRSSREDLEVSSRARTKAMEDKIFDQMEEGGWRDAFEAFISDLVTLKAGVIKGPVYRMRKKVTWEWDESAGKNIEKTEEEAVPEYERISPFDLYPSPDASSVEEGPLVEKIRLSRQSLVDLKTQPGYVVEAIDRVLEQTSFSGFAAASAEDPFRTSDDPEREAVEGKDKVGTGNSGDLTGLEFWCSASGKFLLENNLKTLADGSAVVPLDEYPINAIMLKGELIYLAFNDYSEGVRPYSVWGWTRIPGSFWFEGVPELMSDIQQVCNASVRALVNNMAYASGPQAEVDVNRLLPGELITSITPLKVWQTENRSNNASPAVRFFQPSSNAETLMGVYNRFADLADDVTGIPKYQYGNAGSGQAGRTASGLSMLMSSAAKGLKRIMIGVSQNVIGSVVKRQFKCNQKYLGSEFKGDIEVVPTGIVALMVREQLASRRLDFLNATANEFDQRIVGIEGRAKVLRETAEALELPGGGAVRSEKDLRDLVKDEETSRKAQGQAETEQAQAEAQLAKTQLRNAELDAAVRMEEARGKQLENQAVVEKAQLERVKLQLEIRKTEADTGLKAQELSIKDKKVKAEATKDYAVATDLSSRSLMDMSKSASDSDALDDSGELNTQKKAQPGGKGF